jgi:hypothetical protein
MARRAAAVFGLMLSALPAAGWAADRASAERVLHIIYNESVYDSEIDRLLAEADHKAVFGGAGTAPSARAKDRAMTREALLKHRDAVLRDASERVAELASDGDFAVLLEAAENQSAPIDQGALAPAVSAVKRGFIEAVWDHMARYARSNSFILCREGERSFCP